MHVSLKEKVKSMVQGPPLLALGPPAARACSDLRSQAWARCTRIGVILSRYILTMSSFDPWAADETRH